MSIISSWINSTLYPDENTVNLESSKLLDISNALSNLKRNISTLAHENNSSSTIENIARNIAERIPTMVVVGTQSSGKSSVLNKIMRFPILPTGSMMVTRTPISIELRTNDSNEPEVVEIGEYRDGVWNCNSRINVDSAVVGGSVEKSKVDKIRRALEKLLILLLVIKKCCGHSYKCKSKT